MLYEGQSCGHGEHAGLSEAEILVLRTIEPRVIFTDLDPLVRSVLILHTLRNTTIYDCVVTLHVPGATVKAAYCRALRWLRARQSSYAAPAADLRLQPGEVAVRPGEAFCLSKLLRRRFMRPSPRCSQ